MIEMRCGTKQTQNYGTNLELDLLFTALIICILNFPELFELSPILGHLDGL